jgi:pyruvate formate lyase activating enzyme
MQKGIIYSFKRYSVNDGPGIRQTVFFKGCPLSCWWCHNPESQHLRSENSIRKCVLDGVSYEQNETIGKVMTTSEVMKEIEKDRIFYEESGGGVTFSGGEPLLQHKFLIELLEKCLEEDIHTTVDTTGFANGKVFSEVAEKTRLFLFDLKHMNNNKHIKYTSVPNEKILQNLVNLDKNNKKVIIRFPVIPGVNNDENNIAEMLLFLRKLKNINQMTLLPYHSMHSHKYDKMKMENKMGAIKSLQKKDLLDLKASFETIGFDVKIGN